MTIATHFVTLPPLSQPTPMDECRVPYNKLTEEEQTQVWVTETA